jgi:hypothetical protein
LREGGRKKKERKKREIIDVMGWFHPQESRSPMARRMVWITVKSFRGWSCSDCAWNCPLPTLLSEAEAKSAFDRLALSKFRGHDCKEHSERVDYPGRPSVTEQIRRLVASGYKPKDAMDIVVQEVGLEFRDKPDVIDEAQSEAQDFLRRMREGIV